MNWRRIVWLLALVTLPTLAEETPLQLVLRGAQHDQLYQLSSSGVTKVSALPDSLTTPLGSLWKLYVYAWLEDTHQPEQPYQCRGNSPEEVYCCQAGESITRDTALVRFLWALFCAAAVAYWRRCVGAILATASGTCVVSVSYNAEARNLGNG